MKNCTTIGLIRSVNSALFTKFISMRFFFCHFQNLSQMPPERGLNLGLSTTQLVSSGYYALQASLFELRPDRLLTSVTRWSPFSIRTVLLDTQQIFRDKAHVFQHVIAGTSVTKHITFINIRQ